MEKNNVLTKGLAITGTVLVWFPIAAPILLSFVALATRGRFLLDYLMPMELFMFAIVGSGLLLWATLRAHSYVKFVAWGIGIAILMFFGVQWFAEVTGMASGATEPTVWMWSIAIAFLIVFVLGIVLVGTGGALLLRDLYKRRISAV
jgi:hypothetical protein